VLKCRKCNFIGDRDVTATINLYRKYMSKNLDELVQNIVAKAEVITKRGSALI